MTQAKTPPRSPRRVRRVVFPAVTPIGLGLLSLSAFLGVQRDDSELERYAGRYSSGPYSLFTVEAVDGQLAIVPPFWTSKPYLGQDTEHTFSQRIPHPDAERQVRFLVDENGLVSGLEAFHYDVDRAAFERLPDDETIPIEHFLAGRTRDFLASFERDTALDETAVDSLARQLLLSYPSRSRDTESVLAALAARFPESAQILALHGYALLATSQEPLALEAFAKALDLDPHNDLAAEPFRRLTALDPEEGEGYRALFPHDLDRLFEPPTPTEIAGVRADWRARDLQPKDVEVVHTTTLTLSHTTYAARVVRHRVHGDLHYGAILTPDSPDEAKLPVVLEARGVDPRYNPHDISAGTQLMRALQSDQARFLFVIPALRGETLILDEQTFTAEGNRADSWDGATDDMIALLEVALQLEPKADAERIAAYGKSRGGSVALLTGIRDPRIDLVLDLAGPTDWFAAMENRFFSTATVLRDQLRDGTPIVPTQEGGQFYERFVAPVARGEWSLADARHSMLAGSPLYFLEDLPPTLAFYGEEDRSVPLANATAMRDRWKELKRPAADLHLTVFADRGHDTDPYLAYRGMVAGLMSRFHSGD